MKNKIKIALFPYNINRRDIFGDIISNDNDKDSNEI